MVIVDDNQISRSVNLSNLLSEQLVGFGVGNPGWIRSGNGSGGIEPEEVVE